jgi:hypothetical protein
MGVDLTSPDGWRFVAASVTGLSHEAAGEPCADACAVRVMRSGGEGLLVAVAADGAGTSSRGSEGARLACASVLEEAARRAASLDCAPGVPTRAEVVAWVEAARQRVVEAAEREGLPLRDFSSTLLVAVVGESSALFFQIGDGAIVYRDGAGAYVPALWPQSGEYANCTFFLTDEDATDRVETATAARAHEVALLTDGLQGLALRLKAREAHGPFFEPMFARLREEHEQEPPSLRDELRSFLASAAVNARTDDDKTLVLATRLAPAAGAAGAGGD